jgi:hypothetical protein
MNGWMGSVEGTLTVAVLAVDSLERSLRTEGRSWGSAVVVAVAVVSTLTRSTDVVDASTLGVGDGSVEAAAADGSLPGQYRNDCGAKYPVSEDVV